MFNCFSLFRFSKAQHNSTEKYFNDHNTRNTQLLPVFSASE